MIARQDDLQALNRLVAATERTLAELRAHIAHLRKTNQDTKDAEAHLDAIIKHQRERRDQRDAIQRERKVT